MHYRYGDICQTIMWRVTNAHGIITRLEKVVRDAAFRGEHEEIQKIVDQLCHDYAYAVHQPHARNGGLIGLAAASIALGSVSCTRIN